MNDSVNITKPVQIGWEKLIPTWPEFEVLMPDPLAGRKMSGMPSPLVSMPVLRAAAGVRNSSKTPWPEKLSCGRKPVRLRVSLE